MADSAGVSLLQLRSTEVPERAKVERSRDSKQWTRSMGCSVEPARGGWRERCYHTHVCNNPLRLPARPIAVAAEPVANYRQPAKGS